MPYLSSVTSGSAAAVCLGVALVLAPALLGTLQAEENAPGPSPCICPDPGKAPRGKLWPRSKFVESRPDLDVTDEIAALEALHLALTEVGDGASYVWHRGNGHLSGVVQPTVSFKDADGRICRHVVLLLSSGAHSKRTEGIACRLDSGIWQLDG